MPTTKVPLHLSTWMLLSLLSDQWECSRKAGNSPHHELLNRMQIKARPPFSRSQCWNVLSLSVLFTFSHHFQHQSEANQDRCLHVLSVVEQNQSLGNSQRKDGYLAHRCGGYRIRVRGCIWWMTLGLATALWKGQGQAGP